MSGVKGKSGRKSGDGVFTGRKKTLKNPKKFFGYKLFQGNNIEELEKEVNDSIKKDMSYILT